MAKRTQTAAAVAAMLLAGQTAHAAESSMAAGVAGNLGHVRSDSSVIASAIQDAAARSATFRALVAAIDASDSYVFVNNGHCSHGVRACFVNVTFSGVTRYMFVVVDTHSTDLDLMRSIAHELRHTIEVIGEPNIRSYAAKFFFYEKTARRDGSGAHETRAAVDAGENVRAEVLRFNRQTQAK